ncbi:MAG: PqqD family protein [Candidatus Marinimicrobia bacterium]|nr:PqqD family protein [Candidatus Neomarinimicrobiota bacterium]
MKLFKKQKNRPAEALKMSEIVPVCTVKFNVEEDGTVTLLQPKFSSKFSKKYIIPRMKHPYYFIHLDEMGSAVWKRIDGKSTALEIGGKIKEELGEKIEPVFERLGFFLAKLKNEKFIKW